MKPKLIPEEERFRYRGWVDLGMQVAITLSVSVLLMGLAGKWLDAVFGTYPLFLVIGIMWGAGGGTAWVIIRVKKFAEKAENEQEGQKKEADSK